MSSADIGVVGLGVMGAAIARNFRSRELTVAAYNRSESVRRHFRDAYADEKMLVADDLGTFCGSLKRPRKILLMVTAGRAVDAVLESLAPLLEPGDIVVDGGNSHFPDTARREGWAKERQLRFFGMGVSGGEEGALYGPAMMPGGDPQGWHALQPILESAAAVSASGPCVGYCGHGGAGHFVKMVHNGIEYGDMQLIAEAWTALKFMGMGNVEIADAFARWNASTLASYLIEITADIVRSLEPGGSGLILDNILDVAGQKGTGRWTSVAAIELGVPIPTITAAVDARAMSARRSDRQHAASRFGRIDTPLDGLSVATVEQALLCAKIMSYTQGFDLLAVGSVAHSFNINLAESARIWTGGCIIRADFLDRIREAFTAQPDLPLLFASEAFAPDITAGVIALREVVATFARAGLAAPAFAASLSYFETMTAARGSASMIQAQRDYFGAHTYRRFDDPETPVHTVWGHAKKLELTS
jgi:6-phosphogluconate dehydrogenase